MWRERAYCYWQKVRHHSQREAPVHPIARIARRTEVVVPPLAVGAWRSVLNLEGERSTCRRRKVLAASSSPRHTGHVLAARSTLCMLRCRGSNFSVYMRLF